jgi:lysophospholipase L1-like esterase
MMQIVRWCLIVVAVCGATSASAADFFFKNGDTVVMIGDSITEQHLYSNYVEMWTVTRFPSWKLTFRNVGIGGDRSVGGNARFARDVLLYKPTAMTVDFGMNDGGYKVFGEDTFRPYMDGLQGMANQAKAAEIRVAWCTPQPLDTHDQGPTALGLEYNQTLEKFSEGVKAIADKNAGLFVDQFHPYLAALDRARAKGPKYDRITGGDAVHPGPPGQALMAASILKGLSFPSLVSSAEIDATGKVTAAENCKVESVVAKDGGLSFTRLDAALPFFPADAVGILPSAPILEELNNYRLKVTGLTAGKYEVLVGGKKVVDVTSAQLAEGVNLAAGVLASGPIAEQVNAVKAAVEAKNRFHHDMIYRGVILNPNVPDWVYSIIPRDEFEAKKKAMLDERYAKLPVLDAEVVKTLVMKANTFEIVPVK